jgi:DNA invertase Pin-like site-specific DNA recombinase
VATGIRSGRPAGTADDLDPDIEWDFAGGLTGLYTRISKRGADAADPETRSGVQRQAIDCKSKARHLKWPWAGHIYVDDDVSAGGKKRRKEFEQLLADIDSGLIRRIIIWHPDRLWRVRGDFGRLLKVCQAHQVQIESFQAGRVDFSNATARFMLGVLTEAQTFEVEHTGERWRDKHRHLAEQGLPNGGARSFGFEPGYTAIREDEADLIRDATKRVLAGESLRSVARDWTQRGILGARGKAFIGHTLWQVLVRAALSGRREVYRLDDQGRRPCMGTIVGPAVWDAIITPQQSDDLRALLGDPDRRSHVGETSSSGPLAGLVYCGQPIDGGTCGGRFFSEGTRSGKMRCGTCKRVSIPTDPLVAYIQAGVLRRADSGAIEEILRQEDDSDVRAELESVQAAITQLATDFAHGLMGQVESSRHTRGLATLPSPLRAAWGSLSPVQRRYAIGLLIERIVVLPGDRSGGSVYTAERLKARLRVVWKV